MPLGSFRGKVQIQIPSRSESLTRSGGATPLTAKGQGPSEDSECWKEGKERFRTKILASSKPPSIENLDLFFRNKNRLDRVITECERLSVSAGSRYGGRTGRLLEVLRTVKTIGDPILAAMPSETISLAWSVITLFIDFGTRHMQMCNQISEASAEIVTIILNCRLYESRYQKEEGRYQDEQASDVIERVKELLSAILEFFWHANLKLRKGIKEFFNVFSTTVSEKYEAVISQYKALREGGRDAFEGEVMRWLQVLQQDNAKLAADLRNDNARYMEGLLFPELTAIRTKLDDISADVRDVKSDVKGLKDEMTEQNLEEQINKKFESHFKALKPTDVHTRQFEATLSPLWRGHGTQHLCSWLFTNEHYISWETGASERTAASGKAPTSPNIFYLKGRAGFGKSVTMAVSIERLTNGFINDSAGGPRRWDIHRRPSGNIHSDLYTEDIPPVLFFFFKRGDDATQLSAQALSSLVSQLFCEKYAPTRELKERLINVIDGLAAKKAVPGSDTANIDGEGIMSSQNSNAAFGTDNQMKPKNATASKPLVDDVEKLESIAEAIGKTVYIVIDGVDECTDYEKTRLVEQLIKLGRSAKASFKILISSREDLNIESLFAVDDEGRAKFSPQNENESDSHLHGETLRCISHGDTTMLTVTKDTNAEDMTAFLENSLKDLMRRRIGDDETIRSDISTGIPMEIKEMVTKIRKKAEGMFTYSAMVITSLDQPSPLTLAKRLRKLPDKMDSLYSRQLESLSGAQRRLVVLALKRIVWSPGDMGTLEIAEQFKQIYKPRVVRKKKTKREEFDSEDESEDSGSESEDTVNNGPTGQEAAASGTTGNIIEMEVRKPEIADTIYHLEVAGRDFFKFSNKKATIGLIHKSVRDWVEAESQKAAQYDTRRPPLSKLFSWDDRGELMLTMQIPKMFVKGKASAIDFDSEKEAQLDILIYIFSVLVHPKFLENYMPAYKEMERYPERMEAVTEAYPDASGTPQPEAEVGTPQGSRAETLVETNIKESDDTKPATENESTGAVQETKQDAGAEAIVNSGSNPVENVASETQPTFPEPVPNSGNEGKHEPEGPDANKTTQEEPPPKETYHEGPWRCEIHHWPHHMKRVEALWPREERVGKRWEKLWDLLREFSRASIYRRWAAQHNQFENNLSTERARTDYEYHPSIFTSAMGLEIFLEFLLEDKELNYDIQMLSARSKSPLHMPYIFDYPHIVEQILKRKIDVNHKDKDGATPLMVCLDLLIKDVDYGGSVGGLMEKHIESAKHLIQYGADLGTKYIGLCNGMCALQAVVDISDESLFNLVMENRNLDLEQRGIEDKTAMHTVWTQRSRRPYEVQVAFARRLLEAGANPNTEDDFSANSLYYAAHSRNEEGVKLLLEPRWNVDVNDLTASGFNAICCLAATRSEPNISWEVTVSIIRRIVNSGGDITVRTKTGVVPLLLAISISEWEVADAIISIHKEQGQDIKQFLMQRDINERTILHRASYFKGGRAIAEFVLERLPPEDIRDFLKAKESETQLTAWQLAADRGESSLAAYLLEKGADWFEPNGKGEAYFEYFMWRHSIRYDEFDILRDAYKKFLEFDSQLLLLRSALTSGEKLILKELAELGVDPFERDLQNWDAFDWAYAYGQTEAVQVCFPEQFARVDYRSRESNWSKAFGTPDHWSNLHPNLGGELSDDKLTFSLNVPESYVVRATISNCPISPYLSAFYYEVTITSSFAARHTEIGVGLTTDHPKLNGLPGWYSFSLCSYALHGDTGHLYSPEFPIDSEQPWLDCSIVPEAGPATFGVGDVVGCGYDQANHIVFWTVNGRHLGTIVKDVRKRLYPTLGGVTSFETRVNFGADPSVPFKWEGAEAFLSSSR
ncbi:hypothetical protein ABW19_dt0204755 [Dactylella cylindrospora]|nr:hypothetical protein ABW19_dt0204755 [Dactylella cylindrospora]